MLDSGYILKGVLIDFADILDGCMGEERGKVKDVSKVIDLSP